MPRAVAEYRAAPIYVVLPGIETEGVARLTSSLKQSAFGYRTFDPKEAPRLALLDLQRHVMSSSAVVVPLLDVSRAGAPVHNARCAVETAVNRSHSKVTEDDVRAAVNMHSDDVL